MHTWYSYAPSSSLLASDDAPEDWGHICGHELHGSAPLNTDHKHGGAAQYVHILQKQCTPDSSISRTR